MSGYGRTARGVKRPPDEAEIAVKCRQQNWDSSTETGFLTHPGVRPLTAFARVEYSTVPSKRTTSARTASINLVRWLWRENASL